jgi:hypothetical protein
VRKYRHIPHLLASTILELLFRVAQVHYHTPAVFMVTGYVVLVLRELLNTSATKKFLGTGFAYLAEFPSNLKSRVLI